MGYYDFGNFTQTSTSDGFAFVWPDNATLEIIGGNDGGGNPGMTTATITAPTSGLVQFNWVYNSLDVPGFDSGGYVLNGTFNTLSSTDGDIGTISFAVHSGDTFGFAVSTMDNTGEPGILTVTNFGAPDGAQGGGDGSVPEPATLSMMLLSAGLAAGYLRLKRRNSLNQGKL